ncbi:phosphate ABC transporter permease subunit PstC [Fimbriiglobus ruber]|uniref:Phosphate transport system permease protein PstA n=1 Tax=Fimbriiglobus ruber TaxID=1908690 RepID=A0A225CZB1_9BACT|nr:phosphate ABC transporter permease subunit PstC [Fimbriiglobus ruber]OWK34592.1 Phosphate transport system permease protein PstC [Fimbriiglobus ruber]
MSTAVSPAPPQSPAPKGLPDILFAAVTQASGLAILTLVASLVGVLVWQAWPVLESARTYQLWSAEWVPTPPDGASTPVFGARAFVYGTVVTAAIAMLIAVPLGIATAAYLSEIAPGWVKKVGAFLVELLAAIPSVVYGFWGLFFLAPVIQKCFNLLGGPNTGGNGLLAAGIILAIMVLPYITAISYDVCRSVPRSLREGALALGATRWQTIWSVVLPVARPGITAAAFLALGRALGETMAVTMLIGNKTLISFSVFATGDTIASKISNSLNEADDPAGRAALIALALILLVTTAAFNIAARLILSRFDGFRVTKSKPAAADDQPDTAGRRAELPEPPPPGPPVRSAAATWNAVMTCVLAGCFVLTIVPLFLILGLITYRGVAAIQPHLFTENAFRNLTNDQYRQLVAWQKDEAGAEYPMDELGRPVRRGGLGHAMLGTVMMTGVATLLAVPLGLAAAVYLAEARRSHLATSVRFVTELLGGVPSIVIGIFVYAILVGPTYSFIRGPDARPLGFSGWAGAVALAIMMVPIIVRSAEESMKLVPDALRHASYALGANRMQTILQVILPAALPAIVTGIFLAVGRIAGETAPLLFTAGQYDDWPKSPAHSTPFLTGYIYNYSRSPYLDFQDQAWGATVVLLAVVMVLNVGIRLVAGKRVVSASQAG